MSIEPIRRRFNDTPKPEKRSKQERTRVDTVAFWAKGDEIIENDSSHIRAVLDDPEKFGFESKEELLAVYRKYGEKIGREGKAREEIIRQATRHGWVRVRHYVGGNDYWSIQVDHFRRRKRTIDTFIDYALGEGVMMIGDELRIVGYDDTTVLSYGFAEGGVKAYLEEAKTRIPKERFQVFDEARACASD